MTRRRLSLLVALALPAGGALTAHASAASFGQITSATKGLQPFAAPTGFAAGPDANVWFTDSATYDVLAADEERDAPHTGTPSIGRITPDGTITEFSAGLQPADASGLGGIAAGADGALWFTDAGNSLLPGTNPGVPGIGRATTAGAITELPAGSTPNAIVAGPDGNLWFTVDGTTPSIGQATPAGQITLFTAGLPPTALPTAIAAGPDGNLWFTDSSPTNPAIGRITPAGRITEFTSGLKAHHSYPSIAAGPDGNLWFCDQGPQAPAGPDATGGIGRITPAGRVTEYSSGFPLSSQPFAIAAGKNGLWFTDRAVDAPAIGYITTGGQVSDFWSSTFARENTTLTGIAAGRDGGMWFGEMWLGGAAIGRVEAGGSLGSSRPASFVLSCPTSSHAGTYHCETGLEYHSTLDEGKGSTYDARIVGENGHLVASGTERTVGSHHVVTITRLETLFEPGDLDRMTLEHGHSKRRESVRVN